MKRYELRAIRRAKASQGAHLRKKDRPPMHTFYLDSITRLAYFKREAGRFLWRMSCEKMREARLAHPRRLP